MDRRDFFSLPALLAIGTLPSQQSAIPQNRFDDNYVVDMHAHISVLPLCEQSDQYIHNLVETLVSRADVIGITAKAWEPATLNFEKLAFFTSNNPIWNDYVTYTGSFPEETSYVFLEYGDKKTMLINCEELPLAAHINVLGITKRSRYAGASVEETLRIIDEYQSKGVQTMLNHASAISDYKLQLRPATYEDIPILERIAQKVDAIEIFNAYLDSPLIDLARRINGGDKDIVEHLCALYPSKIQLSNSDAHGEPANVGCAATLIPKQQVPIFDWPHVSAALSSAHITHNKQCIPVPDAANFLLGVARLRYF